MKETIKKVHSTPNGSKEKSLLHDMPCHKQGISSKTLLIYYKFKLENAINKINLIKREI